MLKLKKILVPVDFSNHSGPAANHAAHLAHKFDASLLFLHAVAPFPYQHATFEGGFYAAEAIPSADELADLVRKELDAFVQNLTLKVSAETLVVEGDPGEKIAQAVKEKRIDLVVMPTRGYGPFRRLVLGSVTTKVLNDVDCPVLTGSHVEEIPPTDPKPYRRIACALNLGEGNETVLRWASGFASAYDAKLYVIHSTPSVDRALAAPHLPSDWAAKVADNARKQFQSLLQKVGGEAEIVVEGKPVRQLVPAMVRDKNIDLLFVGRPSEEGLLGRLKTQTYALIRESSCPVVSV